MGVGVALVVRAAVAVITGARLGEEPGTADKADVVTETVAGRGDKVGVGGGLVADGNKVRVVGGVTGRTVGGTSDVAVGAKVSVGKGGRAVVARARVAGVVGVITTAPIVASVLAQAESNPVSSKTAINKIFLVGRSFPLSLQLTYFISLFQLSLI